MRFSRGQGISRLRGAFGGPLARCAQLNLRPLGERPGAGRDEDLVRGAKLIAGIAAAALAAQPLSVEQVSASQLSAQAGASQVVDRLAVKILSDLIRRQQGERVSVPSAQSVPVAWVVSASSARASAARAACPLRTAASISSGRIRVDNSSCGCSLACCAAASASSYRPRPLYSTT
jgi:hypothetical protein